MLQTQLLRLDPPYQIISAGGQVGIQMATLIVTEEQTNEDGHYRIDTHSHPVVSYGLKQGLVEEFKYGSSFPEEEYSRNIRLQPEGAVWNRVEVSDIRVLGLAGANNSPISLQTFISLVPTVSQNPYGRVWDEKSIAKIYDLLLSLNRVGLRCERMKWKPTERYNYHDDNLYLELETSDNSEPEPLVHVVLVGDNPYDLRISEIGFYCRLYDDKKNIDGCVNNIVNALRVLSNQFIDGNYDAKFEYRLKELEHPLNDVMEQVTDRINKELKL